MRIRSGKLNVSSSVSEFLQCFDSAGWVPGSASGLEKISHQQSWRFFGTPLGEGPAGSILSVESNQNVESNSEKCGVQNSIWSVDSVESKSNKSRLLSTHKTMPISYHFRPERPGNHCAQQFEKQNNEMQDRCYRRPRMNTFYTQKKKQNADVLTVDGEYS